MTKPDLVRIEYRQPDGSWTVGHAGIALLNPDAYVARLAERGTPARWVEAFPECEECGSRTCSGMCLI